MSDGMYGCTSHACTCPCVRRERNNKTLIWPQRDAEADAWITSAFRQGLHESWHQLHFVHLRPLKGVVHVQHSAMGPAVLLLLASLFSVVSAQHDHMAVSSGPVIVPDGCVTAPTAANCTDYKYPHMMAVGDIHSLCTAMHFMAGCSVAKACNASGAGSGPDGNVTGPGVAKVSSQNPDVCRPFNLVATVCRHDTGMSKMKGVWQWQTERANPAVVQDGSSDSSRKCSQLHPKALTAQGDAVTNVLEGQSNAALAHAFLCGHFLPASCCVMQAPCSVPSKHSLCPLLLLSSLVGCTNFNTMCVEGSNVRARLQRCHLAIVIASSAWTLAIWHTSSSMLAYQAAWTQTSYGYPACAVFRWYQGFSRCFPVMRPCSDLDVVVLY